MIKGLTTQDGIVYAQLLQTVHEYFASLQTSISSINGVQMLMYMYTRRSCVKCGSHEFFDCLDSEFLNWGISC